jgi:hypothetical protein
MQTAKNPEYWGTSDCKNCGTAFQYRYSQKNGIYCSNQCQGEHVVKKRAKKGTDYRSRGLRKLVLRIHGLKCSACDWDFKAHHLEIHHKDGDNTNNELENLEPLCLLCHADTDTYGSLNISDEGRERLKTSTGGDVRKKNQ